jgi:hypothetical protein
MLRFFDGNPKELSEAAKYGLPYSERQFDGQNCADNPTDKI